MGRYSWFVFTNCTPGDDAEFNDWYDNVHVPDLLKVPGVVACSRSSLAAPQMGNADGTLFMCGTEEIGAKYQYVACYSIESDDPRAVLEDILSRSGTEDMLMTDTLADAYTILFQDRTA
ncbi:MAG: hypothetical protein EOP18_09985 [Rhizobiaceae bacterium]|nr:MAG: hypothetical protein EOP18_09985 [Rhizobiaceae bacterium]